MLLGVATGAPDEVGGYLFDESSGSLVGQLATRIEDLDDGMVRCSVEMPDQIPTERGCVVLEGRWPHGSAGCEMSLRFN